MASQQAPFILRAMQRQVLSTRSKSPVIAFLGNSDASEAGQHLLVRPKHLQSGVWSWKGKVCLCGEFVGSKGLLGRTGDVQQRTTASLGRGWLACAGPGRGPNSRALPTGQ